MSKALAICTIIVIVAHYGKSAKYSLYNIQRTSAGKELSFHSICPTLNAVMSNTTSTYEEKLHFN
jgi:hypothetical protein